MFERLVNSAKQLSNSSLSSLASDSFEKKIICSNELVFDWSKNFLTPEVHADLCELAKSNQVGAKIKQMFAGDRINNTEDRPVLHVALRHPKNPKLIQDTDILKKVHDELDKMKVICDSVHSGQWKGFSGKTITHVVNVGIGGSFLGPKMMIDALEESAIDSGLQFHFVANVDLREWLRVEKKVDLERTLFILSSKSMGTGETLMNAQVITTTMRNLCDDDNLLARHFIAVTANPQKLTNLGIPFHTQLTLWDWVGGRFSVWSSIGLPVALCIGFDSFLEVLRGAHNMDEHFALEPFETNMPVTMALISYWYRSFFSVPSNGVLAYHHGLKSLPDYLQQLDMESNGKSVSKDGSPLVGHTAQVLWGGEGTNGQHAYHQLLHQGTQWQNVDFIVPLDSSSRGKNARKQQGVLVANALAQAQVLMMGKSSTTIEKELLDQGKTVEQARQLSKHKKMQGNRPSNMIMMSSVSPSSLGELIALYEHRTAIMGWMWDINSFDQWGVELGKVVAEGIFSDLLGDSVRGEYEPSTKNAIDMWRQNNL